VICPARFLERNQVFVDCLSLLTAYEPGDELHVVNEVAIPGGSVDHFLVSSRHGTITDFVGIEIQTLDTTGTVWPERQRLVRSLGVDPGDDAEKSSKTFGMNWKMSAKTILVQMHHKIATFEHIQKRLVLVLQDRLQEYMAQEFKFDHLRTPPSLDDSMHIHAYKMELQPDQTLRMALASAASTSAEGIARCLDLNSEARVELSEINADILTKISPKTRFVPVLP
jgi:hypothetical protein